jgi:hypothetical protein
VPAPGVSDFEAQGVLALSTPHENTDVKKLLKKLRDFFSRKVLSSPSPKSLKPQSSFIEKMDHLIHRDTKDYIRRYVEEAGLEIRDWCDSGHYTDSVVVLRVIKPFDPASALALRPGRRVF